ncbi:MAG: ATP-binding domain-containing protein [Atopobiaceae bacterium]|nr:ATP-binding domain-containing protein [Atopobiaceae bacterium]
MDQTFKQEQHHLSETYAALIGLRDELIDEIETNHHGARQDLIDLSEEVRLNFGSDDETMETLAAIETLNSVIDTYNEYHDISVKKLGRISLLLEQPYFAKVTLKMRPSRPTQDVYIGTQGMTDKNMSPLVVDWRSPIAETYYSQKMGAVSYEVNGRTRTVELKVRRQFDIVRNELRSYFDTSVAIEDSLLLEALRRRHSEKLRAITATIQREQNDIIRHEDVPVLLVSGIAGSGKTSVMLQRIAYVLYRQRKTLDAQQICLFSPNAIFSHYINAVLPQLGESNPYIYTWQGFLAHLGLSERNGGEEGDLARLALLSEAMDDLTFEPEDFRAIAFDGTTLLKPSQIEAAFNKYQQFPIGARRCALTAEKLHESFERKISRMAHEDLWQEKMLSLDADEQISIFGQLVDPQDEAETVKLTKGYLSHHFKDTYEQIESLSWLRIDRIGMRMLHTSALSAAEHLWLKMLISGHGAKGIRYVVIDEIQDYTPVQINVLARYFHGSHFLLLGDPNQAIRKGSASWREIRQTFSAAGQLDECHLLTSYRSSPEITSLFASLLTRQERSRLTSVQQSGVAPDIHECGSDYLETLGKIVSEAKDGGGLIAIIVADRARVHWLSRQLSDDVKVLSAKDSLPKQGVVLLDLTLAKGLEFDHVIVADAQEEVYPNTELCRRRLYTAISRATHRVTIISQGKLTPLLRK